MYSAAVLTREDPAYAPTKADPLFVTVGVHSSIQDRQLLPLVKHEFQSRGFLLADFDESKWVLVVGRDDRTIVTGSTSTSVGIASAGLGGLLGVSTTKTHADTEQIDGVILSLVTKESVARGDPMEIWQGKVTTNPDAVNDQPDTVIHALIDQYGKNFDDYVRLPNPAKKK